MQNPSSPREPNLSIAKQLLLEKRLRGEIPRGSGLRYFTRSSRPARIRLSHAQERLWFIDQLEGGTSTEYIMPMALRLKGELHVSALERAINTIVARHESLRTHFAEVDGEPIQVIEEKLEIAMRVEDLSGLGREEQETVTRAAIRREVQEAFDLSRGPLLRLRLLKLGDEEHVLLRTMHHIVSDGWSEGVFNRELDILYEAYRRGQDNPLQPLDVQYADFALWQRKWLEEGALEEGLKHWKENLAGIPEELELPRDRPRLAVQTFVAEACQVVLSAEHLAALKQLSQDNQATLYMTLLAALGVLVSRYSGQDDIVVGSLIANRRDAQLDGLIGFFLNTLPMRMKVKEGMNFRELLGEVRRTALEAYQHQDVPFERLVEELSPERSLNRTPVFQLIFVLQNAPSEPLRMKGLDVEGVGMRDLRVRYDLEIHAWERDGKLGLRWVYNRDLFDRWRMEQMARHYVRVLEATARDASRNLKHIGLLSATERYQILQEWNDTVGEVPASTVTERFEEQVEKTPDAVAVAHEERWLSYGELNKRANQLAHYLIGIGIGPGQLVGICLERSLPMVISILGILKAGGAYLPLDPEHPVERLEFVVNDAEPMLVVSTRTLQKRLPEKTAVLTIDETDWQTTVQRAAAYNPRKEEQRFAFLPHHPAYVIYTSGSTGKPKGVMIEHSGMLNHLSAKIRDLGLCPNDVVAQTAGITFDISVWQTLAALLVGGRVEIMAGESALDASQLLRAVRRSAVTVLETVPAMLTMMLEVAAKEGGWLNLRHTLCTGEPLLSDLCSRWRIISGTGRLWNAYGPTECSDDVTHYRLPEEDPHERESAFAPIGRAICNTRVYVLDGSLEPVPVGLNGELYIAGAGLARGYLKRPGLTSERFVANPFGPAGERMYRTGDLTRWRADGNLEFIGRVDQQVKLRGFRVELGEIECLLLKEPGVAQAVVITREDHPGDRRLVGYVTAVTGQRVDPTPLRAHLAKNLPSYMVPSAIVVLEVLPVTPNGKVDRKALPTPEYTPVPEYRAPQSPEEEILCSLFADVLGLRRVGPDDNFFELGGHSLMAMRLVSRIRATLGVNLAIRTLFEASSAGELSLRLRDVGEVRPPLVLEERPHRLELSHAQERLWFIDRLEGGRSTEYNLTDALRLCGELDRAALESAINTIVERHESLRTHFGEIEGKPLQLIEPNPHLEIPVENISGLTDGEKQSSLLQALNQESSVPFDLSRGPVMRLRLQKLGDREHALFRTMHHIVWDGWSESLFNRELGVLYEAFREGRENPLPPLKVQYADFALWQRRWLRSGALQEGLEYWKKQLAGIPDRLELPTDTRRTNCRRQGAYVRFRLDRPLSVKVEQFSRQENMTVFMIVLGAYQLVLSRLTGQKDILVGVPTANRDPIEIEPLIGMFVNTIVLRSKIDDSDSVRAYLSSVKDTVLNAYRHQHVPFEEVVAAIRPQRTGPGIPLVQAMLVFQNIPEVEVSTRLVGLQVEGLGMSKARVRSEIDLYVYVKNGAISGDILYDEQLFDAATIDSFATKLREALSDIVTLPSAELADLPMGEWEETPKLQSSPQTHPIIPASYHQERLCFIDKFETSTVYDSHPTYHNVLLALRLSGRLDHKRLQSSINAVLSTHECFRSSVHELDGCCRQLIGQFRPISVELDEKSLTHRKCDDHDIVTFLLGETEKDSFDLSTTPLCKARLFRIRDAESVLCLTIHHAITDKTSLDLLVEELHAEYDCATATRTKDLLSPSDYAIWQRSMTAKSWQSQWEFWKRRLSAPRSNIELPLKRRRDPIQLYSAGVYRFELTLDHGVAVSRIAQRLGTDDEAVYLSLFFILLYSYSGSCDFMVGLIADCRLSDAMSKTIGPLSNLLPFRPDSIPEAFTDFTKVIAKTLKRVRKHRTMPFELITQKLALGVDMSRTALFDVLFQYDSKCDQEMKWGSVSAKKLVTNVGYGKYDVNLFIKRTPGGHCATITYNRELIALETIQRMARHYMASLDKFTSNPQASIRNVELLSDEERKVQIEYWNATHTEYPDLTIHELFEKQAESNSSSTVVVCEDKEITYGELNRRANQLARHLINRGVKRDGMVGLCLDRSTELVIAILAVLKAGAAYLPLDPGHPAERLDFMVTEARAAHVVSRTGGVVFSSFSTAVINIDTDKYAIDRESTENLDLHISPKQLAYCIYTSGSTGLPNGVLVQHGNVVRLIVNQRMPFEFSRQDVWTWFHSHTFDFSVWEVFGALLHGGRVVVVPRRATQDPAMLLEIIRRHKVTVLNQTPASFYSFADYALQQEKSDLALRYIIFGGDMLQPARLLGWHTALPAVKLVNMYGITETTVHVSFRELTAEDFKSNISNIGRPIPTTTLFVAGPNCELLPVGVPGEIYVGGDGVSRGYLSRTALTASKYIPDPFSSRGGDRLYRTGDLGRYLPDGNVEYLGRKDHQVKIRGFRIEPGEIETVLSKHEFVSQAIVLTREDKPGERYVAAYVTPVAAETLDPRELKSFLGSRLPDYMLPSVIVVLDRMPVTGNGKVDRKALPVPRFSQPSRRSPQTPTEEVLCALFAEVLTLDQVGVDDSFFDLGGHSFLAVKLVSRIRSVMGVDLPICAVFESKSVTGLAAHFRSEAKVG
jgi:amino acid adenylation domain-containing protein